MEFKRCYGCMRELDAPGAKCPYCGYDNTNAPARQPSHVLKCGTILDGQYVVGRSLGQGGFGITYLGYDLKLEMPVCIKEYYPEGAAMRSSTQSSMVYWGSSENAQGLKDGRKSFVKEAQKAVKLRNLSHVVSVWSVFYENETAYIVMDYIEGETLKDNLVRTQMPLGEKECVELLTPVMQDLDKAHERGIIHRDIKPENIMLDAEGEPVLLDMGAAKDLAKSGQNGSTLSSAPVVSRGFSPREQYREHGNIGPWTDVYAMCATICYCVTGKVPPTPMDREDGEIVDLSAFSPAVARVVEKGLALKIEDRIQTMGELQNALTAALQNPNVKPEPPKPKPPKPEPPKPELPEPERIRSAPMIEPPYPTGTKRKAVQKATGSDIQASDNLSSKEKGHTRKTNTAKRLLQCVALFLALVLGYVGYRVISAISDYRQAEQLYKAIAEQNVEVTDASVVLAEQTDSSEKDSEISPLNVNFDNLLKENADYAAWIYNPGTQINYPVMYTDNNFYYLDHTPDGTISPSGSIFIDCRNSPGFSDQNTIIYGMMMNDGSMFASLPIYKDPAVYAEHSFMYLSTPDKNYRLDLIAGFSTDPTSFAYAPNFDNSQQFLSHIELIRDLSTFKSNVEVEETDHIVTLSTNDPQQKDRRYVVVARLSPIL